MRKFILATFCILFGLTISIAATSHKNTTLIHAAQAEPSTQPMLAIVIDDFGGFDRQGVNEILAIKAPITCAVMPDLENSISDANKAHISGKEVILHMPMESHVNLPRDWYGPKMIYNSDSPEKAKQTFLECLKSVPHAVGANNHIGSGVSTNKSIMKSIMQASQEKGIFFLDSKTIENSVVGEVAKTLKGSFLERDTFLEHSGPSYHIAMQRIKESIQVAKEKGFCIAIGHVGPLGSNQTAKAIADSLPLIEQEGIKIVPLSEIARQFHKSV